MPSQDLEFTRWSNPARAQRLIALCPPALQVALFPPDAAFAAAWQRPRPWEHRLWIAEIVGQHHGFSPQLGGRQADAEVFGGSAWQAQRAALVQELGQRLGMKWPHIASAAQAPLVAGLTSVADWIGSGSHFEDPTQPWQDLIDTALSEAGWVAPSYRRALGFADVFGFAPRTAQQQLLEVAQRPGVYVLEAPMGLGKTEAALYAVYPMLERGQASGIYFALPTQLTSNKIHERFNAFLSRILAPDCPHRSALLLHGKAWLQQTDMGEEGRPGGAWFHQAKRGLLAPFAVDTIDPPRPHQSCQGLRPAPQSTRGLRCSLAAPAWPSYHCHLPCLTLLNHRLHPRRCRAACGPWASTCWT